MTPRTIRRPARTAAFHVLAWGLALLFLLAIGD